MSEERHIEKKPFLKKGTRKFLSNAQVRSQNQKVKLVDFGQDEDEAPLPSNTKPQSITPAIPTSNIPKPSQPKPEPKQKPPPQIHHPKPNIERKKQTVFGDYVDEDIIIPNSAMSREKAKQKSSNKKVSQEVRSGSAKKENKVVKKAQSLTSMLKQQDDQFEEQRQPEYPNNSSFKPIPNPKKKLGQVSPNKKLNKWEDEEQQYKFKSESSDEEPIDSHQRSKDRLFNNYLEKKENESKNANERKSSNILKKYFHKQDQESRQTKETKEKEPMPLTINDIPKQLKEKIVAQELGDKQDALYKELGKIKQKTMQVTKTKERLDEQVRAFNRMKNQYEREMEERNKEFEEKIKVEYNKLNREKKYMKDIQLAGKGDSKLKMENSELRKCLEEVKEEKKRMEVKLKGEIERLKRKLEQQTQTNKMLTNDIKQLQYTNLIKKEKKQVVTTPIPKPIQKSTNKLEQYWQNYPKSSYLLEMLQQNFSLSFLTLDQYYHEANQFYQYYLQVKQDICELESQNIDNNETKRIYKNGKIEREHYKKYIKEIFPFNYYIVHHYNGDIKQHVGQHIDIYYSANVNKIQYTIGQHKQIYFFIDNGTVDLYLGGKVVESFDGTMVKKYSSNGEIISQRNGQRNRNYA